MFKAACGISTRAAFQPLRTFRNLALLQNLNLRGKILIWNKLRPFVHHQDHLNDSKNQSQSLIESITGKALALYRNLNLVPSQ